MGPQNLIGPQVLDDSLYYHCILHLVGRPFLSGIHVFLGRITAIGVRFKVGVVLSPQSHKLTVEPRGDLIKISIQPAYRILAQHQLFTLFGH